MDIWQIVGFMASVTGATSLVPEVMSAFQNRHLNDIAWSMLFLLLSASTLWLTYGIFTYDFPIMVSAGVNVIMEIVLLYLKRKFETEAEQKETSGVFAKQTQTPL